ncbi:MAG: hypothetical protein GC186_13235 [Rhodobacteraceae bacterium]|nr:hypothetical protein [Paracoccaceae bacterium]
MVSVAETAGIGLELNKAGDVNGACRLTYVATNGAGQDFDKLSLDVVVFDAAGIASQRLILDFGAMPKDKTKVVEFDLPNTACNKVSRLLLNDVLQCTAGGAAVSGCTASSITPSSKVPKLPFGA